MNGRNPWAWVTEGRLTYALKLLLVIALSLYLGVMLLSFLDRIRGVVITIVGAIFLAYIIYPVVERLRRRIPTIAAILLVYAAIFVALAVLFAVIVPRLTDDIALLAHRYPEAVASFNRFVTHPSNPWLSRLPESFRAYIAKFPSEIVGWLQRYGLGNAGHAATILLGAFTAIATFVIIPLVTLYLLLDIDRFRAGIRRVVPQSRWYDTLLLLQEFDGVIGGFVRGQLLVALTVGVLLTVVLLIMHVRYAFLLGLLAAVSDLIPYVGAVITFIPAVSIAWFDNGWLNALIVAALFAGVYELEGHVISPAIVSSQVKLSPLIVLIAVLIGAELAGIPGMLVAVPVAGVLRVCILRLTRQPKAPVALPSNRKAP